MDKHQQIVSGPPYQDFELFDTPAWHLFLGSMKVPLDPASSNSLVQTALRRLKMDNPLSGVETMQLLLNASFMKNVPLDSIDDMLEIVVAELSDSGRSGVEWKEVQTWGCALLHYHCVNDLVISQMAESGAMSIASHLLQLAPADPSSVSSSCALLSHFSCFPFDDMSSLANLLTVHVDNPSTLREILGAVAGLTLCVPPTAQTKQICQAFADAEGTVKLAELMMAATDTTLMESASRIFAHITAAVGIGAALVSGQGTAALSSAILKFPKNIVIVSHSLRVMSQIDKDLYHTSIVDAVITSLESFPQNEDIQTDGIKTLSTVATQVRGSKVLMVKRGMVSHVSAALQFFKENVIIQQETANLLSYVAYDSSEIAKVLTAAGIVEMMIATLRKHKRSNQIAPAVCAALSGLTFNNFEAQRIVGQNGGVKLILEAMTIHGSTKVVEMGCLAIGTMCWNNELKSEVARLGGIGTILRCIRMNMSSVPVIKNACRALAQIAFNSGAYRNEMSSQGAISLIIQAMEHSVSHEKLQMHACVALSYLSWGDETNSTEIASKNGYKVLIAVMKQHPGCSEIQQHSIRVLSNICPVLLDGYQEGIGLVVSAMKQHKNPELQEEGCRSIVTLSLITPANKEILFSKEAHVEVIKALNSFPNVQQVQQEGCNAVAHLAYEHPRLNAALTSLNVIALVVQAMKSFPDSAKLQLNACGGLSALAFDNTVAQRQIFELGGVDVILTAMHKLNKVRMTELACSVLGALAWNTDIKEQVAAKAVPEILQVMASDVESEVLQRSTCRALSQFVFNSEVNRKVLVDLHAIPLIVKAIKRHINVDKVVMHGVVALTYLCWENADVCHLIIDEGILSTLDEIELNRPEKLINKTIHLQKILNRKMTPSITSPSAPSEEPFHLVDLSHSSGPLSHSELEAELFAKAKSSSAHRVPKGNEQQGQVEQQFLRRGGRGRGRGRQRY